MKKYLTGTLLFLLAFGLASPTFARTYMHDQGQNQLRRIQQGVYSGELTKKEVRILRQEQRNIRQLKRRYLRDGRISKRERRVLGERYARAGRHIYRLAHNNRRSYSRYSYNAPRYSHNHGLIGFSFGHRF